MRIKGGVLLALLLLLSGVCFASNGDDSVEPAEGFFLPKGDAESGEKAFAELKCSACHWVQNNTALNPPVADKSGPLLGRKQADYAAGWIANSIVSPSHTIALHSGGRAEGSELSRMGDFTEVMTVRQLIDIVAYIKSLGGKDPGKS